MSTYKLHRCPPEIISYTVWLCFSFNLSHRDIEDLLAKRGIAVSYESIRSWCIKSDTAFAMRLKRKHQGYGATLGEVALGRWTEAVSQGCYPNLR